MSQKILYEEAKDPNTTSLRLENLYQLDSSLAFLLAKHPNASSSLLKTLLEKEGHSVKEAVAKHPNVLPQWLFLMGKNCPPSILENPAWSLWLIEAPDIILQMNFNALRGFLKFPVVENALYEELLCKYSLACKTKVSHSKLPTTLKRALLSYTFVVLRLASRKTLPLSLLEILAQDKNELIRKGVAENPSIPPLLLMELAMDESAVVRRGVVGNPKTSAVLLTQLATDESERVRSCVARNPSTPAEILTQLATDESERVRSCVAENSSTPAEILTHFVIDGDENIHHSVLLNLKVPPTLLELLAKSESEQVRNRVARNLTTPKEVLKLLAIDKIEHVRNRVAMNPETPQESLEKLTKDPSPRIQGNADRTLKHAEKLEQKS